MAKNMEFQREQVRKLHNQDKFAYADASIYTVLLDLTEDNSLEDVFMVLHNVATDLGKRGEFEKSFDKAKKWKWS